MEPNELAQHIKELIEAGMDEIEISAPEDGVLYMNTGGRSYEITIALIG